MNIEIIINVLIAIFIYNAIIESIGMEIIKQLFKHEVGMKARKRFKEKLKDKVDENNKY